MVWCDTKNLKRQGHRYYKRVGFSRTTIYSVLAAIFLLSALSHAQAPATDQARNRILALDPRWTVSLTSPPAASPGFDQQNAYVPLAGGSLIAIDLNDGAVKWTVDIATSSTPAAGDGMVFLAGDSFVLALNQETGQTLWRAVIGSRLSGPLFWNAGWVLTSTIDGDLLALHATDGRLLWRSPVGAALAVVPSAFDERIYAALENRHVVAVDRATGTIAWTLDLDQEVTGLLAVEDQLLLGTRGNRLHSISPESGRIRWSQRAGADVIGAPTADESNIYFVAFDNVLRALNRGNGNLRWNRNLPSRPSGGPLRVNDVVLVPFATNDIGTYLATTGAPAFTIRAIGELAGAPFLREIVSQTAPRLIAISREGALQGFAPRIEPPPAPLAELPGVRVGS
jgi:outer membrane protein assembly factor BamB